jgi:hypothetical protein
MVPDLVQVDPAEQVEDLLVVGGDGQGVLPVLDLRVAAEQEPAAAPPATARLGPG